MGVVDDDVGDEGTRTAFSPIEEEVGSDGGDCGSQEQQLGVPAVLVDCGEEPFGQVQDGECHGSGQRQSFW